MRECTASSKRKSGSVATASACSVKPRVSRNLATLFRWTCRRSERNQNLEQRGLRYMRPHQTEALLLRCISAVGTAHIKGAAGQTSLLPNEQLAAAALQAGKWNRDSSGHCSSS